MVFLESETNDRRPALMWALGAVASILIGSLAGSSHAQGDTPPVDPGTQQITVDLATGVVTGVLPFDQPFSFSGTTSKKLTRIAGKWCELTAGGGKKAREQARQIQLRAIDQENELTQCPGGSAPNALLYPRVGDDASGTTRNFSLYQDQRLAPNRNFVFVFEIYRELDSATLAGFKQQVRAALDQKLRDIYDQGSDGQESLTAAQYTELLVEVDRILNTQPMQAGETIAAGEGADGTPAVGPVSVFAQAANLAGSTGGDLSAAQEQNLLQQDWTIHFDDVYITQVQRRNALSLLLGPEDDPGGRVQGFFDRLSALGADPTLAALHSAITDLPADKRSSIDQLLTQPVLDSVQALIVASRRRLANIAQGIESLPGGPTSATSITDLQDLWLASDADGIVNNLNATIGALEDLADLTKTAQRLDILTEELGDKASALSPLRSNLIAPAINDLILVRDAVTRLQRSLAARSEALSNLTEFLRREARANVPVVATTGGSFSTRARFHISTDLGLLYAGEAGLVRPYFGANFYTKPVNRDVPLSVLGGFRRRFSFLAGLTLSSVKEMEAGTDGRVLRDDLFASQTLAVGFGYRLGDTTRLAVGALVYQENDPNPLIDNLELKTDFFVSLSFDQSLRQLLGPIGNLFGTSP